MTNLAKYRVGGVREAIPPDVSLCVTELEGKQKARGAFVPLHHPA
jgi:hypothetical protein